MGTCKSVIIYQCHICQKKLKSKFDVCQNCLSADRKYGQTSINLKINTEQPRPGNTDQLKSPDANKELKSPASITKKALASPAKESTLSTQTNIYSPSQNTSPAMQPIYAITPKASPLSNQRSALAMLTQNAPSVVRLSNEQSSNLKKKDLKKQETTNSNVNITPKAKRTVGSLENINELQVPKNTYNQPKFFPANYGQVEIKSIPFPLNE